MATFYEKISSGLGRTRVKFQERMNVLLNNGPDVDEDFWEGLEDALISSDIGATATMEIVDELRDEAKRKALKDAYEVFDLLNKKISEQFCEGAEEILDANPATYLFVGINGTGKTTTVGKIAKASTDAGRKVILGSADTFRAAAIEQLEVWSKRANVEMVTRKRGSDPASVCYDTLERADEIGADLVLIDTAGRLHTSNDLMMELEKVCHVTRSKSKAPVYLILVIDATTGQNGLTQAKQFNNFLKLDGLIITKLDGTAKGGIALAVSKELQLPVLKVGVGEGIDDLRDFNASDYAKAFIGDLDSRNTESSNVDNIEDVENHENETIEEISEPVESDDVEVIKPLHAKENEVIVNNEDIDRAIDINEDTDNNISSDNDDVDLTDDASEKEKVYINEEIQESDVLDDDTFEENNDEIESNKTEIEENENNNIENIIEHKDIDSSLENVFEDDKEDVTHEDEQSSIHDQDEENVIDTCDEIHDNVQSDELEQATIVNNDKDENSELEAETVDNIKHENKKKSWFEKLFVD